MTQLILFLAHMSNSNTSNNNLVDTHDNNRLPEVAESVGSGPSEPCVGPSPVGIGAAAVDENITALARVS